MDSSNVLTALEELEKWHARRIKIRKRLAAIRRERWFKERELEAVVQRSSQLVGTLFSPRKRDVDAHVLPPFLLGR